MVNPEQPVGTGDNDASHDDANVVSEADVDATTSPSLVPDPVRGPASTDSPTVTVAGPIGSDSPAHPVLQYDAGVGDLDSDDGFPGTKKLGKYVIQERIGRGGMGVVWKAFDPDLRRTIAIKVLGPHLAHSEKARLRFQREARAAAAINHPNTLTIHSVEEHNGVLFLVMEYVSGQSLREYIAAKGKIEPLEVVRIGQQIAQGLAAAHAQGVIHRDIKPGNVMLHKGATLAQLSDFGLARVTMDNADLSSQDQCVGTPSYMSPEMLRGQQVDARSDLFGLGCVFFQMLMGDSPFRGRTQAEVILKILDSTPKDLHELNADVPPVLSAVVRRLLEKDPNRRYQSAAEVAEILSRLQRQLNLAHSDEFDSVMAGGMPPPRRSVSRRLWIAMPIALMLGAFFTRDRWVPVSLTGFSGGGSSGDRTQVEKFKEITVGLGPDADYATIAEAIFHADVDATITVEGGGAYAESVVLSGPEYNGLKLIASSPTRWSCEPIDEPCALTIKDVENVEVRGFDFEVDAIKGRAISVSDDARNIRIQECKFRHVKSDHKLSLLLVRTTPQDETSTVEIDHCEFTATGKPGFCLALGSPDTRSRVICTNNRFESLGTHLFSTENCRQLKITGNEFIAGVNGINLSIRSWYPDSQIEITNNTFLRCRYWIGLMDSFRSESLPAGKTTSRVCNNLILGGERVQGGDDQWAVAAEAFEFGANWWERDSTTLPLRELHRGIATQHDQLDVPEREDKDAENFLFPIMSSPLLNSGVGGDFPNYIGAKGLLNHAPSDTNDHGKPRKISGR